MLRVTGIGGRLDRALRNFSETVPLGPAVRVRMGRFSSFNISSLRMLRAWHSSPVVQDGEERGNPGNRPEDQRRLMKQEGKSGHTTADDHAYPGCER
jgi:hypothetical protein